MKSSAAHLRDIFLHISLNGLTPCRQPQQIPFRSSVLHGGLLQEFPYHVYCTMGLSAALYLQQVTMRCRSRATWLYLLPCMRPSCTGGRLKKIRAEITGSNFSWTREVCLLPLVLDKYKYKAFCKGCEHCVGVGQRRGEPAQ